MMTDSNYDLMRLQDEIQGLKAEITAMQRKYDDMLKNLDSDNITEVDFGRTRWRNAKGGRAIATQEWVAANFMSK